MIIRFMDKEGSFDSPVTVAQVIAALAPEYAPTALGCFCGGGVMELNQTVDKDCSLYPVTFQNEEGRRIYERSLRFILLLAIRRVFPGVHLRIEHSIGYGIYAHLLERPMTAQDVKALQAEMKRIVREDLPFTKETWTRQQAIQYFQENGNEDKVRLLSYRPYDYFNVYRCGGMAEYFYGAMLPSTGCAPAFRLRFHAPGMVMQMPSPQSPLQPSSFVSRPKILSVFAQSNRWCDILGCQNAADLNDMTVRGELPDFIRVNEALHDQSIGEIAQGIARRGARAVFVAGPSSSGKTTFSNRLCIHLRVLGLKPVLISLDDFYRDRDALPLESDGMPDLEALSALDVPLLRQNLSALLRGETVEMPRYNFKKGMREYNGDFLTLGPQDILVIEGIHCLNDALS